MQSPSRILVTALSAVLLLPAAASAQEVIEPMPPLPCGGECWWPVGATAQLDAIEADIEVGDGVAIARYRFELSNPVADDRMGGAPRGGPHRLPGPCRQLRHGPRPVRRTGDPGGPAARCRRRHADLRGHRAPPHRSGAAALAGGRPLRGACLPGSARRGACRRASRSRRRCSPRARRLWSACPGRACRRALPPAGSAWMWTCPGRSARPWRRASSWTRSASTRVPSSWAGNPRAAGRLTPTSGSISRAARGSSTRACWRIAKPARTATSASSSHRSWMSTSRSPATSCSSSTVPAPWKARRWSRPSTPPSTCSAHLGRRRPLRRRRLLALHPHLR